jgi:hypothetical protein
MRFVREKQACLWQHGFRDQPSVRLTTSSSSLQKYFMLKSFWKMIWLGLYASVTWYTCSSILLSSGVTSYLRTIPSLSDAKRLFYSRMTLVNHLHHRLDSSMNLRKGWCSLIVKSWRSAQLASYDRSYCVTWNTRSCRKCCQDSCKVCDIRRAR